jgi:hypothetical protein
MELRKSRNIPAYCLKREYGNKVAVGRQEELIPTLPKRGLFQHRNLVADSLT